MSEMSFSFLQPVSLSFQVSAWQSEPPSGFPIGKYDLQMASSFFYTPSNRHQISKLTGRGQMFNRNILRPERRGLWFCSAVYLDKMIRRMQTIILEIIHGCSIFFLSMLIRSSFNFLQMTFSIKSLGWLHSALEQRSSNIQDWGPYVESGC